MASRDKTLKQIPAAQDLELGAWRRYLHDEKPKPVPARETAVILAVLTVMTIGLGFASYGFTTWLLN